MENPLCRETALQNLSSPEQLNQLIKITQPRAWLVLAALGFVLCAGLIWSVFGSLPSTLSGQGISIRRTFPGQTFLFEKFEKRSQVTKPDSAEFCPEFNHRAAAFTTANA